MDATTGLRPDIGVGLSSCERSWADLPMAMENSVREYDWGSREVLADLQHRPPSDRREAELWMGAHRRAPSRLRAADGDSISLEAAITSQPQDMLGDECLARFGPRLPYLLKVLAVDRPLSIQVHPGAEQAADGFARERSCHLPERDITYVDPYAKPELLVALRDFAALAGLRDAETAGRLVEAMALPQLRRVEDLLRGTSTVAGFGQIVTERANLDVDFARMIAQRACDLVKRSGDSLDPQDLVAISWVCRLAENYPDDVMILAPLLLEVHQLAAQDAIFLPPGVPHAYLSGVGVEIMGSSDNVVRAGLTTKRVDAAALVDLVNPGSRPVVIRSRTAGAEELHWSPPVGEFALSRMVLQASAPDITLGASRPVVALCLNGGVDIRAGTGKVTVGGGHSVFIAGAVSEFSVSGSGEVFLATTGDV